MPTMKGSDNLVRVCDAIMGTGKSSAAITYMNEHPNDRFIYITPYLPEAKRIKDACPALRFVEPSNKIAEFNHRKVDHTQKLIELGRNVATTHASFELYTPEMLNMIKEQGYTLIIDENMKILDSMQCHPDDLKVAVDAGYIIDNNGSYTVSNKTYRGEVFAEVFRLLQSRELVRVDDGNDDDLYYWVLPPDLLMSFKDVFILTYLFEGQGLYYFMKIYNIPYTYINITMDGGTFRFTDGEGYTPGYLREIKEMIEVYDGPLNDDPGKNKHMGGSFTDLSMSWFERDFASGGKKVQKLGDNITNYFRWKNKDTDNSAKMWAMYSAYADPKKKHKVKVNGYARSHTNFNERATNKYKDKLCLAYPVNVFMNVNEKKFYYMHGIEVDESVYALSIMVQWIWRAAIRDGCKISIYVPSRRMREMLLNWIDDVSAMYGGCA